MSGIDLRHMSGPGNTRMVQLLRLEGVIVHDDVEKTMLQVDRSDFVINPTMMPYFDQPQSIGYNATISAPHMHAYALELLREPLMNGKKILDVGSGTGYLTACFALMSVDAGSKIIGVEHIKELCDFSIRNLKKKHQKLLDDGRLEIMCADGRKGLPDEAPFDAIHVGAASAGVPEVLLQQLAPGGKMVCPVGPPAGSRGFSGQRLVCYSKSADGKVTEKDIIGVRYVPLIDRDEQLDK